MIAYRRNEIDAGPFSDLMPGAKFYRLPELPKITFEADRVKYTVTDLQTLNETAVNLILKILEYCCLEKDVSEFNCRVLEDADENGIERICDIVSAFGWSAKKGGRNGFDIGSHLIIGCHRESDIITFDIVKEFAKAIYEYYQSMGGNNVSYYGIIIAIVNNQIKRFSESV